MLDFNDPPISVNSAITLPLNMLIDAGLSKERNSKPPRSYLGASRLGSPCARNLQYEYIEGQNSIGHNTACNNIASNFSGGTLRIFEAGHLFEDLAARWLRLAGFELVTEDSQGKQFGFIVAGGKIAGNIDGIITKVPSELISSDERFSLNCPMLWEAKSMNNKSWNETAKKGLTLSKPIYAAQLALYQAYMSVSIPKLCENSALFTAINKNTSEVYHELIPFDADLAQRMSDKAVNIIKATECGELLPRAFSSREFYECKMCSYKERCWDS